MLKKKPKVKEKKDIGVSHQHEYADYASMSTMGDKLNSDDFEQDFRSRIDSETVASAKIDLLYLEKCAKEIRQRDIHCEVCGYSGQPTLDGCCPECGAIGGIKEEPPEQQKQQEYNRNIATQQYLETTSGSQYFSEV